jgi:hypothetical protein
MLRKLAVLSSLVVAMLMFDVRGSAAGPISPRNPYRSFNISGVNYGSMRWEQQNRGRSWRTTSHRSGGFLFRRR